MKNNNIEKEEEILKEFTKKLNQERLDNGYPVILALEGKPGQFIEHYKNGTKILQVFDENHNMNKIKL